MKKLFLWAALLMFLFSCKQDGKPAISETDVDSLKIGNKRIDSINSEKPIKKSIKELKAELYAKGFQTYDYIDEKTKDTVLMQQYYMAFLKSGPVRQQNEEEAQLLQNDHLAHLNKMYELGYADISGPFGDNGAIRGVTIYNVPTLKMADSLAKADPMVRAGRLVVEIHPWWAAKGFSLR